MPIFCAVIPGTTENKEKKAIQEGLEQTHL